MPQRRRSGATAPSRQRRRNGAGRCGAGEARGRRRLEPLRVAADHPPPGHGEPDGHQHGDHHQLGRAQRDPSPQRLRKQHRAPPSRGMPARVRHGRRRGRLAAGGGRAGPGTGSGTARSGRIRVCPASHGSSAGRWSAAPRAGSPRARRSVRPAAGRRPPGGRHEVGGRSCRDARQRHRRRTAVRGALWTPRSWALLWTFLARLSQARRHADRDHPGPDVRTEDGAELAAPDVTTLEVGLRAAAPASR